MARTQLALDLAPAMTPPPTGHLPQPSCPASGAGGRALRPPGRRRFHARGLVPGSLDRIATVENGHHLALLDQIKAWCADSHTRVTVKPVIDLNERIWVPGYDIPDATPRAGRPQGRDLRVPADAPGQPEAATSTMSSPTTTPTRPPAANRIRQPRSPLSPAPSAQDPPPMALPDDQLRGLRVDLTPRLSVPPRPNRHDSRPRPTRPVATPPPAPRRDRPPAPRMVTRGHSHLRCGGIRPRFPARAIGAGGVDGRPQLPLHDQLLERTMPHPHRERRRRLRRGRAGPTAPSTAPPSRLGGAHQRRATAR